MDRKVHGMETGGSGVLINPAEDLVAHGLRLEQEAAAQLADKKKTLIGEFSTDQRCVCGKTITDLATETDPGRVHNPEHTRLGPMPTARDLLARFHVFHRYLCTFCGITYDNGVIEGTRGYVPRERRPEDGA